MIIKNKEYKEFQNVYFIAEIGINHNGSLDIAKKLIEEAANAGADAVKFQKRDPNKLWTEEYLNMPYNNEYSFGKTYGEHKMFLEFNDQQYFELKSYADKMKVDFLVGAFDVDNVDFIVKDLKVPAIKVPSPFITHLPYLTHITKYKLPLFVSTGMHYIEEIDQAVNILKKYNSQFVLLQCVSLYPVESDDVNLRVMQMFSKRYNCEVGYSGHDKGVILPAIAATLGAIVIEKHFTLDRTMRGPDHAASLEPRGLNLSIKYLKHALKSLGSSNKTVLEKELLNRQKYCFSVKAKRFIKKNEIFSEENLTLKSPRNEKSKKYYNLLGLKAEKDFKKDEDII